MSTEKKNVLQKTGVIWALAMICCFLWGSAFPCIKIGYRLFSIASSDTGSQIVFAGIRFFLAGILAILFASVQARKILYPRIRALPKVLTLSLFQTILQYLFFYMGLAHTTGVKGSIIGGTTTFFAILIAAFLFHQEKFTAAKALGCVLGFAGLILVNIGGLTMNFGFTFRGEGFMLISAIASAMSTACLRIFSQKENPVMLSGYQFLFGGAILVVFGKTMGGQIQFSGGISVLLIFYMAIISSVAYSLWGILLKYNDVSKITIFGFMTNVFGVVLSALFLREYSSLNLFCLAALILVCAGIIIVNRFGNRTRK